MLWRARHHPCYVEADTRAVQGYIAMPQNMYQSIHTTLIADDGMPFEVIRTWEMYRIANSALPRIGAIKRVKSGRRL